MLREEALFKVKDVLDEATEYEDAVCYVTGDDREWLELAIKALEQESVLDKIRAEIDDATEIHSDGEFYIKNIDVKRIIDKYKVESEE